MTPEIPPKQEPVTGSGRNAGVEERDKQGDGPPARKGHLRVRLPVGVALGLVFSLLLVLICGIIITYMAAADRRIAGRLLDEQGLAVLNGNEAVLQGFFAQQELLLRSFAAHVAVTGNRLDDTDLEVYGKLLPEGARLDLGRAMTADGPAGQVSRLRWLEFRHLDGFRTGVMSADLDLGNGQVLSAHYPQPVFAALAKTMEWEGRQQVFLLAGRDRAIVVGGLPESAFAASADAPLPALGSLTGSPLHLIWKDQDRAFDMSGGVSGRVFPGSQRMFTAIFTEVQSGPAAGWTLGTLYQAADFGAALDQTQIVLYAALVALVVGAVLSFIVGRLLGRPLSRLAHAAAQMRTLEFAASERLPRSLLVELDDVNQAFNGSIGALNAFAKYVPRQLVSRLVEEGMTSTRNIEIKEMTIVFTDLAGFTDLASHMSAEETASYLNGYFETVSEAISERHGTIDKFLGDGVMAFWGAPSDQPDHAALAIAAVRALAERIEQIPAETMRVRIGVHTGKVVVGDIGSAARMNYTVIGDAVNVAARLQEHGKTVDPKAKVIALASAETMRHLPEGAHATSLGTVQLRGREEPLSVFRIA
ncbi:adenylate/guanylate cyclase domain-containing protein [Roseibium sp.]|uniref:adenylate/guanylate cyclase domain-containing protein n=1 Tax=Roseibium sp. TaxID=1936156 RepID=UPI003265343A